MPRTRAFKSGNSQTIRIPARDSLKHAVAVLRGMRKPARVEKRRPIEVRQRRGD